MKESVDQGLSQVKHIYSTIYAKFFQQPFFTHTFIKRVASQCGRKLVISPSVRHTFHKIFGTFEVKQFSKGVNSPRKLGSDIFNRINIRSLCRRIHGEDAIFQFSVCAEPPAMFRVILFLQNSGFIFEIKWRLAVYNKEFRSTAKQVQTAKTLWWEIAPKCTSIVYFVNNFNFLIYFAAVEYDIWSPFGCVQGNQPRNASVRATHSCYRPFLRNNRNVWRRSIASEHSDRSGALASTVPLNEIS